MLRSEGQLDVKWRIVLRGVRVLMCTLLVVLHVAASPRTEVLKLARLEIATNRGSAKGEAVLGRQLFRRRDCEALMEFLYESDTPVLCEFF